MDTPKTGPDMQAQKPRSGRERLRRLNLWVPENVHSHILREASLRNITISACAGLKLADDISSASSLKESEGLRKQVVALKYRIAALEEEKKSNSNLPTLYANSRKAIKLLQSEKEELLKQKATAVECSREWQKYAASMQEEHSLLDEMLARYSILRSKGLSDDVNRSLRFVLLGERMG